MPKVIRSFSIHGGPQFKEGQECTLTGAQLEKAIKHGHVEGPPVKSAKQRADEEEAAGKHKK